MGGRRGNFIGHSKSDSKSVSDYFDGRTLPTFYICLLIRVARASRRTLKRRALRLFYCIAWTKLINDNPLAASTTPPTLVIIIYHNTIITSLAMMSIPSSH